MLYYLLFAIAVLYSPCSGQYLNETDECIKDAVTVTAPYTITDDDYNNGSCGYKLSANGYIIVEPKLVNISHDARIRLYLITGNTSYPAKVKIYEYNGRFLFRNLVFLAQGYQQFALVVLSKNASNSIGKFRFSYRTTPCSIEMTAEDWPLFNSPSFFPKNPTLSSLLSNNGQSYQQCTYNISSRDKKPFTISIDVLNYPYWYSLLIGNQYVYGPTKVTFPGNQTISVVFTSYYWYWYQYGFSGSVEMSYQLNLLSIDDTPYKGIPQVSYLDKNYTFQHGCLSSMDTQILCMSLGYGGVKSVKPSKSDVAADVKLICPRLQCMGPEKVLTQCSELDAKKLHYKSYYYKSSTASEVTCTKNFRIRLVGGDNTSGSAQIKYGGHWAFICADNMDPSAADAICNEMGFNGSLNYEAYSGNQYSNSYWNYPNGEYYQYHYNTVMNYVRCNEYSNLKDCSYQISGNYLDYIIKMNTYYNNYYNYYYYNNYNYYNYYNYYYYYYYRYCMSGAIRVNCKENTPYSLLPGHYQGYLLYNNNMVCYNNYAKRNADVYCRFLGYPGVRKSYSNSQITTSNYVLVNLKCTGNEKRPADCPVDTSGCTSTVAVGTICQDVSLSGGSTSNEGRIEIYRNGKKGLLCDDYYNINTGNVICRQLGYAYADNATRGAGYLYGYGNGNFIMDMLNCYGYEDTIHDCPYQYWGLQSCYGNDVAGVVCQGNVSSCGLVSVQETNPISVNGYNTTFGANPWQVRIIPRTVNEWCSGTIIDKDWVITAANCFTMSFDNFFVTVGSSQYNWDSSNWVSTNNIRSVYIHPQYSAVTGDYNLALLKINSISFDSNVQPVCLPKVNQSLHGLQCITTGWNHGKTTSPRPLLGKSVIIKDSSYCKDHTQFDDKKMSRYLCSENNMDPSAFFNAESGGPLVCSIDGENIVVGVVARSISGARLTQLRLYTRTDSLLDWILNTIHNN